jgi:hypothetical protein
VCERERGEGEMGNFIATLQQTHLRRDIQESDKSSSCGNHHKMTSNLESDLQRLRKPKTYSYSRQVVPLLNFAAPYSGEDGGSM